MPSEIAKFLPSADGKNFYHFKVRSVILLSIFVANGTYSGIFMIKLVANIAWKRNVKLSLSQNVIKARKCHFFEKICLNFCGTFY